MRLVGTNSIDGHLLQTVAVIRRFTDLLGEIEASVLALSLATPQAQRLTMTVWIAQARVYAEELSASNLAAVGVEHIAGTLRRLARVWWPGSVIALRHDVEPARALRGVSGLKSWTDVLDKTRSLAATATSWADGAALEPPAHDAAERLAEVLAALERFGGPLSAAPNFTSKCSAVQLARADLPRLRQVAAHLRWLRGSVESRRWGAAIGRVRGLARHLDDQLLDELLDPSFSPASSWAVRLGEDLAEHQLMATRPTLTDSDELLSAWVRSALGSSLAPQRIRGMVASLLPRIGDLDLQLGSRRLRRRLGKTLASDSSTVDRAAPPAVGDVDEREAAIPHVAAVRSLVQGKRAAFMTNRKSPKIRFALRDLVDLSCDIIVNKVRRRQALCKRIAGGRYDLVMVAHGFLSHGDTAMVRDACGDAGIPFIAVDKGRPATLIRLLFESLRTLKSG